MTTTDFIALAAVAITAIGLVVNFLSAQAAAQSQARFQGQVLKRIEELKHQYALDKEVRDYELPQKMKELAEFETWLHEGVMLSRDILKLANSKSRIDSAQWQADCDAVAEQCNKWSTQGIRLYDLAIRYGPALNKVMDRNLIKKVAMKLMALDPRELSLDRLMSLSLEGLDLSSLDHIISNDGEPQIHNLQAAVGSMQVSMMLGLCTIDPPNINGAIKSLESSQRLYEATTRLIQEIRRDLVSSRSG